MSSNPSDVLGTVFLWVCFCILASIAYLSLTGDGKPTAPQITLSHHYVEPQAVLPPPLWSFDLPPPREPPQPTFEPRPEPEPLPRRQGLIPRAERRVRPAVFPERHVQRERPMTQMSTRKRVAAADKQAAKQAHQAQKEQDLHWRSKATAHKEGKAERKQDAASRTGSERKQLDIDLDAAKNRPSNAQNIKIERPPYEGSNAFTGTALGDKSGTAYAPPMDIEEAGAAAKPLAGEVQQSDHTPADNTAMAPEKNPAANQSLAGAVQEASDVVADHSSTTEGTQSVNPLLELNDEDAASGLGAELGMLQRLKADFQTDETWNRRVLWVYTSWWEWITCGNTVKWHVDKLNEAQTLYFKPMVDEVFALFDKRCGKRNEDVPADALNHTLAVVSEVRDNINEALGLPKGGDSIQDVILDQPVQPPTEENEKTTSDVQSAKDEQFDHVQEQILEDLVSAERLHRELNQDGAQISSDRELAKKVSREQELEKKQQHQQPQQRKNRKPAPVLKQTYIHGDPVDQMTRTCKQDYPQTAVASGSGTYPKDKKAHQEEDVPESPLPWPKLPTYKVVKLASEQVFIPSFHALAGGVQESDCTPAEDATMVLEEPISTGPINVPDPVNPLLEQQNAFEAWKMLASWLKDSSSRHATLTDDKSEAWYQDLCRLFRYWSQWMECGGDEIWTHIQGCDVIPYATCASKVHGLVKAQLGEVTREMENVYSWMNKAKDFAEKQEQARIDEEARQQSIHMAQMQQQEQAQKLQAEKQEEQARINEEQRQEAIRMAQSQQQQLAQNPPVEQGDEEMYGNDMNSEESRKATTQRQAERAQAESNDATDEELEANLLAEFLNEDKQPDSAVKQQPTVEAFEPRQQAPASSTTTQQPSRATTDLSKSRWNTPEPLSSSVSHDRNKAPMGEESQNAQPKAAVQQQQRVGDPFQPYQQAPPAPLANFDAMLATRQDTYAEPQTDSAKLAESENNQPAQDGMDTFGTEIAPGNVRPSAQKIEPQNSPTQLPASEIQKKHQGVYKMNMDSSKSNEAAGKTASNQVALKKATDGAVKRKAEDEAAEKQPASEAAKRKAAEVAIFTADRSPMSGPGKEKSLFASDDVQKRHQDDVQNARAQAEADVAAAAAQQAEYKAAQAANERTRSIAETTRFKADEVQFMSIGVQKRHQFQSRKDLERAAAVIAAAKKADAETRSAAVEETKKPDEVAQETALEQGWEMSDIKIESGVYPLQGEVTLRRALVLVTAWLQLNNELVSTLQKQFRQSDYKARATTMPHGPHFMAKIKQMSSRYCQLKQYTCVKVVGTEHFDWNLENISLKDINRNGLGQLISKDKEFLTTLKDAFATPDRADKSRQIAIDESRKLVLEAYANVMAVSHAITRIPSPSESSDDDTDSDDDYYRDATPAVKAALKKEVAEQKASRSDTRPPVIRPS